MLSFFPTPYSDELLYSVLARYHVRSGNISPKMTILDLYGSTTVTAVVDLPCHIENLVSRLPLCVLFTAEQMILGHTLYPYYAAFLLERRATELYYAMKGDFGGDIHINTGIVASTVKASQYLRYCPICMQEDIVKYGESYWHRLHHVPGVLVCPEHKVVLLDSQIKVHGLNKHEYIAADMENCQPVALAVSYNSKQFEKLLVYADDVKWLLENYNPIMTADKARERYLTLLEEKGFATVTGRVYQREFTENFVDYYSDKLLKILCSEVNCDHQNNWLACIVRKHRKAFYPLRHLLLIRFCGKSPEEFFREEAKYKPFGSGPWPCLNAGADHYRHPVIKEVTITHCADTKLPVGTFKCSCGFIYSRRGIDSGPEELYRIGRVKEFGPVWESKLKQLLVNKNLSLREIARRLNVDPNTVRKYAGKLNIKTTWKNFKRNNLVEAQEVVDQFEVIKSSNREKWLALANNKPDLPKSKLRKLDLGLYAWLYSHDRKWLDRNSPTSQIPKGHNNRVDWNERDKMVFQKVKKVVNGLLNSDDKPERVTLSRIGKKTGMLSLLEKHLDRMKMTREFLDFKVETVEDFQVRRLKWAARQLDLEGQELKEWKIVKKAGLKPGYSYKVQIAVINEIERDLGLRSSNKIEV